MMPPFKDAAIDPRRRAPHGEWTPEGREEATARMPAFGREFFDRLFAEFPILEGEAAFLRWSEQPGDAYAFFDRVPGIVVQVDPDLGYVVVSGRGGTAEFGDWGGNEQVRDALGHVRWLMEGGS